MSGDKYIHTDVKIRFMLIGNLINYLNQKVILKNFQL